MIPGGLAALLQSFDGDFIFVHRHQYLKVADQWASKNLKTKRTAAQRQILGTHFTAAAYKHANSVVNIAESFKRLGYIWPTPDGSHIQLWELPNYKYDVSSALICFRAKPVPEADNAAEQPPAKKKRAQPSLMHMWKK